MKTPSEEAAKWDSLLRCLYLYVEANPDRFQACEQHSGGRTIIRIVRSEDSQENERRVLRPLQFRQPKGDLD